MLNNIIHIKSRLRGLMMRAGRISTAEETMLCHAQAAFPLLTTIIIVANNHEKAISTQRLSL